MEPDSSPKCTMKVKEQQAQLPTVKISEQSSGIASLEDI